MHNKRVLYINNFSTIQTGSPEVILEIMENLPRDHFSPFLMVNGLGDFYDKGQEKGIPTFHMKMPNYSLKTLPLFIYAIFKQIIFCKKHKIRLIHINYVGWKDSIVIAAKLCSIPTVLHCHNNPDSPKMLTKSWNVQLADKIVTVSKDTASKLSSDENIIKKLLVIYNAISLEKYMNGNNIREQFNLTQSHFVIGLVGQICDRKSVLEFLIAAKKLVPTHPNLRLLIVGKAPQNETNYKIKIEKYAAKNFSPGIVTFTGVRHDIENIMKSIDLLVLPSKSEPFGRVIIEAMAASTPCLGNSIDGICEVIKNNHDGVLADTSDINNFVNVMDSLINNPDLLQNLGNNAMHSARKKYSISRLITELTDLYKGLVV